MPNKSSTKEKLIAEKLKEDPRIEEATNLLLKTIEHYQKSITGPKEASVEKKGLYEEIIKRFEELRGAKLWYPYIGSGIGNGALVELMDGSVKYDMISGIGVHYLGHSHPKIAKAAIDAALTNTVMQGNLQQNIESVELTELFVKHSGMDHCFLSTSGAMANENALKIAFQKKHPASRVLAFENCFFGRSLAGSQISDKPAFRVGLPLNLAVDYIPFFDAKAPDASTKKAVSTLEKHIARYPKQHAVMCIELIQGEGGFNTGKREFFVAIMDILKKHSIVILNDEVQTFGRTSKLFAFQHFDLQEYVDIVTVGKLTQVCATLYNDAYKPKPGLLSQTFTSSTAAIEAAICIIEELVEGGYFGEKGKIQRLHTFFTDKLKKLIEQREDAEGPTGLGAMIAFTPFNGDSKWVNRLAHVLFENGVISFVAGSNPTKLRFLIPVGAIEESDIEEVMKILDKSLSTVQQEIKKCT